MKTGLIFGLTLILSAAAHAQGVDSVLESVEANNLGLKAMEKEVQARIDAGYSDAALSDLDFEFAYLFGPENLRRHDLSVSQSFDIASIIGSRRKTASSSAKVLRYEYMTARKELLNNARQTYYRIVYYNALIHEYEGRVANARTLKEAYAKGLEEGEFSILDYRKVALALVEAEGLLKQQKADRDGLLSELRAMNGGEELVVSEYVQERVLLPASFDDWFDEACEKSSSLAYVRAATEASEQSLKLAKSESWPTLSVGYMAEVVPGEAFRGVTVGVSLPLWSSSKKISSARQAAEASRMAENQAMTELEIMARTMYDKAMALSETLGHYDEVFAEGDVEKELGMALEIGSISLLEYIVELGYWYDSKASALQAELDYMLAVAELLAMEI